ncbi:MAG TPA: hypothetical protein VKA34_17720 [Balneolales bacterium]|nr:hypothetical protein [Balneolales bacterium]
MQNRSFVQYLSRCFRDCGSEVAQALILNKILGFAKPSCIHFIH